MSDVTSRQEQGIGQRFIGEAHHDDRIDVETEISSREAAHLLLRCLALLLELPWLFLAKCVCQLGTFFVFLYLPWVAKIVIDNVLLQQPLGDSDNPYPPFMNPVLSFLEGMPPLEIMFTIAVGYLVGLILIGTRSEAIGGGLFGGVGDETGQAENKISFGWTSAGGIWGLLEYWANVRLSQGIANNLRTRLFERLTRLPMAVLTEKRTGDSIYRVLYDTASVPLACTDLTITLFMAVLGALVNMYLIQYSYGTSAPELVWIAWSVVPLVFVITFPASNLMRRVNQTKRSAGSATTNAMEETVGNIDAVQSLGGMRQETEKFANRSLESYFRERVAVIVTGLIFVAAGTAVLTIAAWVVVIITDGIIEGSMTPGDFGVLFGIFWAIVTRAIEIGVFWLNVQDKVAPARRAFFFIDYESDDDQTSGPSIDAVTEGFRFKEVDYQYPDGTNALHGINLDLPMDEIVAFVGPSGAGKTSLAFMLPGFLRPTTGKVLIDSQDLAGLNIDSVRSQIAYVFQEHLLLAESIRENLLLANPNATAQEMHEALDLAECLDFVDAFPHGIDTVLGRTGNTLSVGQQQRLCIARGLIRNARVLILDEPTAALDPETEARLFSSLRRISGGRLVIVIAHRLSTIRRADRIVFLSEGTIDEEGSHDELMAKEGGYRRFVELQS